MYISSALEKRCILSSFVEKTTLRLRKITEQKLKNEIIISIENRLPKTNGKQALESKTFICLYLGIFLSTFSSNVDVYAKTEYV